MSVNDGRGRRTWARLRRMSFESEDGRDPGEFLRDELDAIFPALPNAYAPTRWRKVGVDNADLGWHLERLGVTPGAYALAVDAGLRDLHSIAAR
jgi:hypothetical protein